MRFLALLLALTLLLGGCMFPSEFYDWEKTVPYSQMQYTRPDMAELENKVAQVCDAVATAQKADGIMTEVYSFYDLYDSFLTNWYLANIRYSGDLTDTYWETEYNFCTENVPRLDKALEQVYMALAVSPLRPQLEEEYFGEGFFESYEEEPTIDEHYLSLLEREAKLENDYYALSDEALTLGVGSEAYYEAYTQPMAGLLGELVKVRQEMAAYLGFGSYSNFSYYNYGRSYTPEEALKYLLKLKAALRDIYIRTATSDVWEPVWEYCDTEQTFAYLKKAATNMGGTVKHAFDLLESASLYDIGYGENKYDSSFSLYLWSYNEPFIFMNPYMDQTDKLTLAHEFGHFANDYVCSGSYAGTDVAEVHSQAFEYLSLCYTQNFGELARYKLADSLSTFMDCAAYAVFEHRLYAMAPEDLTPENIIALYERTGLEFGFDSWDWDSRDFITVVHFFTEPMYMISYVVSNDLALQFYQMERKKIGSGLSAYEEILKSQDSDIIAFTETYGLESPFAEGRLEALAKTFEEIMEKSVTAQTAVTDSVFIA